ncbi:MAG TPA: PAS domain-containing protein [Rhizomicrobium sp.]|nr:PAS domain-containing protein [Rhizomicrobium sp.]
MLLTRMPPTEELGRKVKLDEIKSPRVQEGHAYWLSKCNGRAYPSRADINPADIKHLLPHVILVHILGEHDYQYRIVGEANVKAHGFNANNWRVSQLDSQVSGYTAMMTELYAHMRKSGRPFAAKGSLVHIDRAFREYESIYMPLGPVGGPIDHLFAVCAYSEPVH